MPTIARSLEEALPKLAVEQPPQIPREIPISASSTRDTDPPKAIQLVHVEQLFHARSRIPSGSQVPASLSRHIPHTEAFHWLRTEGDVVRATNLYLLHPVNEALRYVVGDHSGIICSAEERHGTEARTDISWSHVNGGRRKTFAILEIKNTCSLDYRDFAPAIVNMTNGKTPADMLKQAYKKGQRYEYSLLLGNARTISKQTRKYFDQTGCRDVAVFDWNAMFIFDFSTFNEGANQLVGGTWFQEDSRLPSHQTFRMLLFGMLCRALGR